MRAERGGPSIKGIVLGKASYLTEVQRGKVSEYQKRVEGGSIFGPGTEKLLGKEGTIHDRLDKYFRDVERGINRLKDVYCLNNKPHVGGSFAAIKKEATRVMWNYGITTKLFSDDQQGLFLLGVASMNLSLRGKKGEVFEQERRRMKYIIRMLAHVGDSYSVKVEEWERRAKEKAEQVSDERRRKIYEDRAAIEAEYTASNFGSQSSRDSLKKANDLRDETVSSVFNESYQTMLHLQHVQGKLENSDTQVPVDWMVTNLTQKEFIDIFGCVGMAIGSTILLPRERDPELEQHEYAHTQTRHKATFNLGSFITEADAERLVDNPRMYSRERLLSYYVDDVLDSKLGRFGTREAERIRRAAAQNRLKAPNSPEEAAWNRLLVDNFGLEGFLSYYMVGAGGAIAHDSVKSHLLDVPHGAFRLKAYNSFYEGTSDIPLNLYEGSTKYIDIVNDITELWRNADPRNIYIGERLSADELNDLFQRLNTVRQIYGTVPAWERILVQLEECAWMKQKYPDAFTAKKDRYPQAIFDEAAKPFIFLSLEESQIKDIQTIAQRVQHHLEVVEDTNVQNYHNSLRYLLLRLAFGEYDLNIDKKLQRQLGQGLLYIHNQLFEETVGDRLTPVTLIREEILEPLAKGELSVADLTAILNPVPEVIG